ncbi:MAG: PAS domain-containing protein [Alphaproteobacteria bacterium]
MKNKTSQALYKYWNEVRGQRIAPKRLELDPVSIAPILRNVFILERRTPTDYHFRLAGTSLCAYLGGELRGRSFATLWRRHDHEALESLLYSVTEDACGGTAQFTGYARGERAVPMELLLLPLMRENGTLDRVVGTMVPLAKPYWLGMWPLLRLEMGESKLLFPNGETKPAQAATAGQRPGFGGPENSAAKSRFRVINGGRLPAKT